MVGESVASTSLSRWTPSPWIVASLGGYALVGGLLTLLGWTLDIRRLTDWDNNGISQMPNNALGVAAAGAALVLLSLGRSRASSMLASLAAAIGALTLSQYLSGIDLGIDKLLIYREWGQRGTVVPGRMGPPGSTSLTIIGISIVLAGFKRTRRYAVVGGLLTAGIAMLSAIGYLFDADTLYTMPRLTTIAFQTSTILLALGIGLVFAIPESQPMKTLLGDSAASLLVRRALPGVILLPVLLGLFCARGQARGLFDPAFGMAILVLSLIALLTILLWWSARSVRVHETAKREGRERLSRILGSITDAFMTLDANWRFVFVNEQAETRMGKRRQELVGKSFWEIFPDAVGNETHSQLHRAMSAREAAEYEVFYPPSQRWFAERAYPTAEGGLVVYSQDITERKRAEQQLRRSTELLTFVIDRSPTGFYIVDSQFRISHVNADSQARAFRNVNPAIGRRLDDAMRVLWPEPLASEIIAIFRHTLDTGEPYRSPGLVSPRADLKTVETYEWQLDRITMPDGTYGVVCYFYDTTRLREAEAEARESEERFRTLADNIPQLAWIADGGTDGQVHWFNKNWFDYTGATLEQMKGAGWREVLHPDHAECVIRKFSHHVQKGLDWEDTFPLRRKDGQFRWFLSRSKVIRGESGEVVRIFGTNTDVTDQREMEDKLRQLAAELSEGDRRKDEFLATLAHELRNPLAPLRNGLEVMRLARDDANVVEESRTMMGRQLEQMVRLVDDLMDVSRITRGKLELRKERVDLAVVLNNAVETSRPLIESSGHELSVGVPATPVFVEADVTRLGQVFANLLNNAAKYSERGGRIVLTVERQGSDVVVSVKDFGIGIPTEMLPRIFDMFTQVDRSLDRSQGGLGIGLSLVKRLVEMHGGSVEARSDGHGRGSEFVVRLPVHLSDTTELMPANGENETESPTGRRRILVADDNADTAASLATLLRIMGNEVRTAKHGLEAVEIAEAFRPDVILLDIGMPQLNGFEACRRIRDQPWGAQAVLVALTGWGQDEDRQRSEEAGFDHHMIKPVDPAALEKLLASLTAVGGGG